MLAFVFLYSGEAVSSAGADEVTIMFCIISNNQTRVQQCAYIWVTRLY